MITEIFEKNIEDVYRTSIVQQTAFWSEVKRKLGLETTAIDFKVKIDEISRVSEDNCSVNGDVLVIIKKIDRNTSVAYVPYGPEIKPGEQSQSIFLEELSEIMRSFLPSDCIMVRFDLAWESYWAKEPDFFCPDGKWLGPPASSFQEIRFNYNTVKWNFKKALSNNLPSNTIFIDLTKSKDDLLKSMKQKTRYNISLSKRKKVTVRIAGIRELETWYRLYRDTSARNHIYLHDINYFRTILSVDSCKTQSPANVILLIAETDHKPLASMFLVISGNRATYLYGASSSENRNMMASYALQWEAMNIAKEMGCTEYDMFGVAPASDPGHPLYGLYRFKSGFGGELFHSLGCWDYPFDLEKYKTFCSVELTQKGYHDN
ncbi:MAG TPA: peptidoglycan bridge formation glycyltransferase FemA/FemB family protein [Bacteroidales bacterium]|jgi:lipid II:glycine glycyltransferase (peptidoglycan interpeptide bridge formation enzyme)|nr:peptidoglycan bridge formation glycyltransferase FemA/FemB family protein [Bacteroidales bacterium]OQB61475.1 MAG: Lipid II:glycine glycyltransferase [Bacteroidetes bacterium ADurb.Bin145]NMD02469.1 peptidoglycan bridge formation glycyltransferase FemA/FemB family protein [Bacteroidales bacterium]HOU02688.1 peptidoglycan bridge formation glycyltransferase FemA/FemB family protein [Bacteroidales bacterium]HQG62699.1 peptidoglycan bridge formation glycyltransferase FemA/FemB family protein [Ba